MPVAISRLIIVLLITALPGFLPPAGAQSNADTRQRSIESLLQAHERTHPGAEGESFRSDIRKVIEQAAGRRAEGNAEGAAQLLDHAYRLLSAALGNDAQADRGANAPAAAAGDPPFDQSLIDERLSAITTLLQILLQQDANAGEARNQERTQLVQAIQRRIDTALAMREEDPQSALAMLDHIYTHEKNSIRHLMETDANKALARPGRGAITDSDKSDRDYSRLDSSVTELLNAHGRILDDQETDQNPEMQVAAATLRLQRESHRQKRFGETAPAQATLDQAYRLIQHSVMRLREGRTLVRSLDFDSPKDEYAYEIERHDMHLELAHLLIGEGGRNVAVDRIAGEVLNRSNSLRGLAEKSAAGGDYEAAVRALEDASSEIYKLFRVSGFYVPE